MTCRVVSAGTREYSFISCHLDILSHNTSASTVRIVYRWRTDDLNYMRTVRNVRSVVYNIFSNFVILKALANPKWISDGNSSVKLKPLFS